MMFFIKSLPFLYIFFLLCFLNSLSTLPHETALYKGYKTLWKPYSRWYFPEIKRRNESEDITLVSQRTTYVTIDWDYKRLFGKDDYDYEYLPPKIVEMIKMKMLNKEVTKEFKLVRDNGWHRRWQNVYSSTIPTPAWIYPNTTTTLCITTSITTPRTRTSPTSWKHPSIWETPESHKTIIWAWTTTPQPELTSPNYDLHDDLYEDFYTYLRRRYTKVGGKTEYRKPLPTMAVVLGTTFIWRFWSYNPQSQEIETFLALETEKPKIVSRRAAIKTGHVRNLSCYVCGLDLPGIPRQPSCNHVFENEDGRYSPLRHFYKRRCVIGKKGKPPTMKNWYGELYKGGCFKRFTDVGIEYNERGCRTMEPTVGKSFASKRFARLEKILYDVADGCVSSPFASLTPFSRAISLYVRYHACVCTGRYCNQASHMYSGHVILSITTFLSLFFIVLILRIKSL